MAFKINEKYAENMNHVRRIEESQRIKDRYGEVNLFESSSDSSDSSDDETAKQDSKKKNLEFLKTLSKLKSKDDQIYNPSTKFYDSDSSCENDAKEKVKQGLSLKNYDKEFLKAGGDFDQRELDKMEKASKKETYVEEQKRLKDAFKSDSDSENENFDAFVTKKQKLKSQTDKEHEEFLSWMKNKSETRKNSEKFEDLEGLRQSWTNDKIDPDEQYLRDYILDEKWKAQESEDESESDSSSDKEILINKKDVQSAAKANEPTEKTKQKPSKHSKQILMNSEDEDADDLFIKKQNQFESEYNFKNEVNKITSFPRIVEDSVRHNLTLETKKSKRKIEKAKAAAAKKQKLDDFKLQKKLKKIEIAEKLAKIIGQEEIENFDDTELNSIGIDLDKDFDAEEHDKLMEKIYGEQFYGDDETVKPEWDDLNEEMEMEQNKMDKESRSERRKRERKEKRERKNKKLNNEVDEEANSDLEATIEKLRNKIDLENVDAKKNSQLKELEQQLTDLNKLEMKANDKNYFKYRQTEPNDFGLSLEDILMADDKELNKWAPLSKVVALRSKEEDVKEREYFHHQRYKNTHRVKRVFKSLFDEKVAQELNEKDLEMEKQDENLEKQEKQLDDSKNESDKNSGHEDDDLPKTKNKTTSKDTKIRPKKHKITSSRLEAYGIKDANKFRKDLKKFNGGEKKASKGGKKNKKKS